MLVTQAGTPSIRGCSRPVLHFGEQSSPLAQPMETAHQIRIGTAGWSYKDWDGIFYPPEVQRQQGASARISGPLLRRGRDQYIFLRAAEARTGQVVGALGAAAANPGFLFTAKLHRSFTHSPIAVMGPTSAATIKPTDEDESRGPRRPRRAGGGREAGRAPHPVPGVVQEH